MNLKFPRTNPLRALLDRTSPMPTVANSVWSLAILILCVADVSAQSTVYITRTGANVSSVVAIDTTSNLVVATIPVGASPTQTAVDHAGARAYVANTGSDSISVIDTSSNSVIATILVGDQPSALAVTPNDAELYVGIASGAVQVIDTATHAVLATINVGGSSGIAFTPDGSRAYVAGGQMYVIDTTTRTVINTFAPGEGVGASNLVINADGTRAYVTVSELFGGGVAVLDLTIDSLAQTLWMGSLPGQIAIAPDGSRVYVGVQATWVDTGYGAGFFPGRSVSVIDTLTNTFAGSIDLGASSSNWSSQHTASGIAVTADRSAVYIGVPRLAVVAVANVNTNVVGATVAVVSPGFVATQPGSGVYVPYTVTATDDAGTVSTVGGTAVANVLTNDRLGGLRVTLLHVALSEIASTNAGVGLDPNTASVNVAADLPIGNYTLDYRICERASPENCDDATVNVTVRAPYMIDAVDDNGSSYVGQSPVANVLANDSLTGVTATLSTVTLTQVASSHPGVTLNTQYGAIVFSNAAPTGPHTLTYRICEKASPTNCDTATATVELVAYPIIAADDSGSAPRTGGMAVTNVLSNDRFVQVAATFQYVTLALVSSSHSGVSLDIATGAVRVAAGTTVGTHTLVYEICEIARPSNCDQAVVTVMVPPYVINAVDDFARASSKRASTGLPTVFHNDTFAGVRAGNNNVRLSFVSLTPANNKIQLDLTDGSVDVLGKTTSATYALVYELCELASPSNCDRATVTLELSGGF
jgi:YVTN family beta-propeller protein